MANDNSNKDHKKEKNQNNTESSSEILQVDESSVQTSPTLVVNQDGTVKCGQMEFHPGTPHLTWFHDLCSGKITGSELTEVIRMLATRRDAVDQTESERLQNEHDLNAGRND